MARFEIKMPKLGESITEGTILSWSVQVGDVVNEDDVLFEVNTAKVSAEIPSPVAGKVVEILFKEGDTVPVGTVVAIVDMDGEGSGEASETAGSVETASAPKAAEVSGTASVPKVQAEVTAPKVNVGIRRQYFNWHGRRRFLRKNWIRFPGQVMKVG